LTLKFFDIDQRQYKNVDFINVNCLDGTSSLGDRRILRDTQASVS